MKCVQFVEEYILYKLKKTNSIKLGNNDGQRYTTYGVWLPGVCSFVFKSGFLKSYESLKRLKFVYLYQI